MSKAVVVYHSGAGHTTKQAEAIAEGSDGTLISIDSEGNITENDWEELS